MFCHGLMCFIISTFQILKSKVSIFKKKEHLTECHEKQVSKSKAEPSFNFFTDSFIILHKSRSYFCHLMVALLKYTKSKLSDPEEMQVSL